MNTSSFDWLASFTGAFDPSGKAAQDTIQVLTGTGYSLFLAIAFLYLSWVGIKTMFANSWLEQLGDLIPGVLTVGIIAAFLGAYPTVLGWINEGFSQIAATIAGGTGAQDLVWVGFRKIIAQAVLIFETIPGLPDVSLKDILDLGNSSKLMTTWLVDLVVSLLAMIAMGGAAVLFMVVYSYSLLMFTLGAIVGPILLPFYLLSPFKFMAEGWLKFMVAAGMYRVVAIAIIAVLSPFLAQMQTVIGEQAAYFTSATTTADKALLQTHHLFFSMSILVFSIAILYMLSKVPDIVSSLLSGNSSGTGIRFGGGPKLESLRPEKKDPPKNDPPSPPPGPPGGPRGGRS